MQRETSHSRLYDALIRGTRSLTPNPSVPIPQGFKVGTRPADAYTPYEQGLERMKIQLGHASTSYVSLLVYEQRLSENIRETRLHGDTEARRADRTVIVRQLNELALSELHMAFNDLCELLPPDTDSAPHEDDYLRKMTGFPLLEVPNRTEELKVKNVYIAARPGEGIVFLHVYAYGADHYGIFGHGSGVELLTTEPTRCPHLSLGEMVQGHQHPSIELPRTIRELIGEFSHSSIAIRKWLKSIHQFLGDKLCLVIADHTDFEIPWEMLTLAPNEYLGAAITTVRWQVVVGGDDIIPLTTSNEIYHGYALSYINRQELPGVEPEIKVFNEINAANYDDIIQFRNHLQRSDSDFALIYMACHGIFDADIRNIALGSQHNIQQRLRLADLRGRNLRLLNTSQGIVFLNACHSGRHKIDEKYIRDEYRRGFAELFLSKGARGVIGTLGGVGDTYAASIAHNLIVAFQSTPTMPIAVLLRQLRAHVVNNLSEDASDEDLLLFVYTFMYVYYGNPRAVLQLKKREEIVS
jgi:hypothetical protein